MHHPGFFNLTFSFCQRWSLNPGHLKKEESHTCSPGADSLYVQPWNLSTVYCLTRLLVCLHWLNFVSTYPSTIIGKIRWLDNLCSEGQDAGEKSYGVNTGSEWVCEKEKRTKAIRYLRSMSGFNIKRNFLSLLHPPLPLSSFFRALVSMVKKVVHYS